MLQGLLGNLRPNFVGYCWRDCRAPGKPVQVFCCCCSAELAMGGTDGTTLLGQLNHIAHGFIETLVNNQRQIRVRWICVFYCNDSDIN